MKNIYKKLFFYLKSFCAMPSFFFVNIPYLWNFSSSAGLMLVVQKLTNKLVLFVKASLRFFLQYTRVFLFTIKVYWSIYTIGLADSKYSLGILFIFIALDPWCFFFFNFYT